MKLSEPKKHSPQSTKDHTFLTTFPKTLLIHRVTKACPEVLSQGTADLSHQGRKIRKEKRCSKGWKMVYSIGLETRGRVCPHTRMTQSVSRTIAVAEILRADQSSRFRGTEPYEKHHNKKTSSHTEALSESEGSTGGHWKSRSKKKRSSIEDDDQSQPWVYEETETAKVERWAMPTWCHMFNSTLTGSARVWFDDLPPESVDSYDDLKKAFLANFRQQKKCIKDPPWQKVARQRITQSFSPNPEISFPPLEEEEGFSGEIIWPLGKLSLQVKIGDEEHSTSAWMNFVVVRSSSPYNRIIGRPGVRKIQAVSSTAHKMIKFPVTGGVLTLRSSKIIPIECASVSGPEEQPPAPIKPQKRELR
ncbi:reverse transcriptase domain-containing protein [Tanacetum coccineum]